MLLPGRRFVLRDLRQGHLGERSAEDQASQPRRRMARGRRVVSHDQDEPLLAPMLEESQTTSLR